MTLDVEYARSQFPALSGDWTFLDNAGGSQTLRAVADRVRDYLIESNVQLGASYEPSRRSEERVRAGQVALATMMNAGDPSEVVVGPSTTALLRTLASSLGRTLRPGDEIVVTNCDHEANIGPWRELERLGARIRTWRVNPESFRLEAADLEPLLGERTRLVAVPHVSNVLGAVHPIRAWADLVHAHGARLAVDAVAYAPHRRVDVAALGADFYAFSLYKVYGPHLGVLWGRMDHLRSLPGVNHFFIGEDDVPYKFQPGNANYELTWGAGAVLDYLCALGEDGGPRAGGHGGGGRPGGADAAPGGRAEALEVAFARIAEHETRVGSRLLDFLAAKPRVRIVGPPGLGPDRVPTLSFTVDGVRSSEIPPHADESRIGIRWGGFYARRLIEDLGLEAQDGVVRVSLVHYNTIEEVDRLIEVLDPLL